MRIRVVLEENNLEKDEKEERKNERISCRKRRFPEPG